MSPTTPDGVGTKAESGDTVPLRVGGPCPRCGADIEELDFLSLPSVAVKREMYEVCVVETDTLPTPWRHPTAIAYHEDPTPWSERDPTWSRTVDTDVG